MVHTDDQRLIEYGFPCHQVGAETQRERECQVSSATSELFACLVGTPAIDTQPCCHCCLTRLG